ncbi:MAG: hypothetical protein HYS32_00770 [Candidatus Woesearchaeota archaeon]|nr:MAG: hypothetical protein HYS32_00770 [Candidatus Woesearchaeota archaeon]
MAGVFRKSAVILILLLIFISACSNTQTNDEINPANNLEEKQNTDEKYVDDLDTSLQELDEISDI